VTFKADEFLNDGSVRLSELTNDDVIRIKGRVNRQEYDEIVRKMRTLHFPFMKNAVEIESETVRVDGDETISQEPSVEEAIRIWARAAMEWISSLIGWLKPQRRLSINGRFTLKEMYEMRYERVKAINVLGHAETEIKLSGLDSVVVVGPNGRENLPLWLTFPWWPYLVAAEAATLMAISGMVLTGLSLSLIFLPSKGSSEQLGREVRRLREVRQC